MLKYRVRISQRIASLIEGAAMLDKIRLNNGYSILVWINRYENSLNNIVYLEAYNPFLNKSINGPKVALDDRQKEIASSEKHKLSEDDFEIMITNILLHKIHPEFSKFQDLVKESTKQTTPNTVEQLLNTPIHPDIKDIKSNMKLSIREAQEVDPKKLERARKAIERGDIIAHDVAAEYGQMFDNVKHMTWFLKAVAEEL